ncbi:MAG: hypothetical protein R3C14_37520 [Caldilineaceae bacterium]
MKLYSHTSAKLWASVLMTAFLLTACVIPPQLPAPTGRGIPVPQTTHEQAPSTVSATQAQLLATLPNLGAAPELTNETWFNSEALKLMDLRGKVVMVEFWTYG